MNTETDRLLAAWREGTISGSELQTLLAVLETAEGRKTLVNDWFLEATIPDALRSASGADLEHAPQNILPIQPTASVGWSRWRPLSAAAGLVVGFLSASVVWAISAPRPVAIATVSTALLDGGFEAQSGRVNSGFPKSVATWSGDASEIVTTPSPKAKEGTHVLRFLQAEGDSPGSRGSFCDVFQVVDLTTLHETADPMMETTIELSASFLDGRADLTTPAQFFGALYFFRENPTTSSTPWPALKAAEVGSGVVELISERNTPASEWRKATVRCLLPPAAKFAVIHIAAGQPSKSKSEPSELGPLFADYVKLIVKTQAPLPVKTETD